MNLREETEKRIRELPFELRMNVYASIFWTTFYGKISSEETNIEFLKLVEGEVALQERLLHEWIGEE